MTKEQRDLFPNLTKDGKPRENTKTGSRAWGRVHPKGLFPTIVVGLYASDSRLGNNLHWDDHRYLTTMEARRAQGFPDNEVLLGTPADGWKLMGNSVARSVALALGLSLREAWLKNDPDDEPSSNKANNSLPVLHEQKLDRRSGIQVVIPAMARRSKRELGPTEASVYPRTTVHAEQDSRNLVNPSNPTVTPHKSRRASFVPQSELLASREDGPSIDFVARTVSANTNRRSRVIPDSAEASANEESISEDTFQRFVGSLALKTPSSRDEQGKPTLLKRPHHMLQQSEGPAMERTRKVPRVIIPSTSSSSIPGSRPSYSRPKTKPVNPTTLANKLKDIKRDQDHREAVDFSDNGEDGEFDVEVVGGPSSTAQSSSVMDRNRSRTAPQASSGKSKAPWKGKPKKPVLISLLSEDEDEDEDELLGATAGPPSRPLLSSSSYVPVDNSNLIAYAQTNRVLHQGKNRKRVVVR
jgi:DNA (cytosine-5)-methyltransferase 1